VAARAHSTYVVRHAVGSAGAAPAALLALAAPVVSWDAEVDVVASPLLHPEKNATIAASAAPKSGACRLVGCRISRFIGFGSRGFRRAAAPAMGVVRRVRLAPVVRLDIQKRSCDERD